MSPWTEARNLQTRSYPKRKSTPVFVYVFVLLLWLISSWLYNTGAVSFFFSFLDECPITIAEYSASDFKIFADTPASSALQFVVEVRFL